MYALLVMLSLLPMHSNQHSFFNIFSYMYKVHSYSNPSLFLVSLLLPLSSSPLFSISSHFFHYLPFKLFFLRLTKFIQDNLWTCVWNCSLGTTWHFCEYTTKAITESVCRLSFLDRVESYGYTIFRIDCWYV